MGLGPSGVFIVESPGVDEIADQCSEGPVVTEMLKLLGMPYISRRVESRADLERDARIYGQRRFDVLLFSAHGAPGEIALTTGETVPVSELLHLYKGPSSTAVLFSSCEVLAGEAVSVALASSQTPDYVLGYQASLHWHSAALASVMLLYGLAQNQFGRLLSTLMAIRECANVNVCGFLRTIDSERHRWFSTEAFIQHAQESSGATNEVELSVLIAQYMQKEGERFQQRTDEYCRQLKKVEELNREGSEKHSSAHVTLQRLRRPSDV